jgi:hypothetical protein
MTKLSKLLLLVLPFVLSSCLKESITPGNVTSENRITPTFSKVNVSDGFQVEIVRGSGYEVAVEAPEGFLRYIYTSVQPNGELSILLDDSINPSEVSHKRVLIAMPALTSIVASGGSEVYTTGIFSSSRFTIDADGGSFVETNIATDELNLWASGGSDVRVYGEASFLNAQEVSGASRVFGFRLLTDIANLALSGGSEVQITAINQLNVKASGASTVKFAGYPDITKDLTGGSQIIDSN